MASNNKKTINWIKSKNESFWFDEIYWVSFKILLMILY